MPALPEAVSAFADTHGLLPDGAHILVACSGGPDSSVLLDVLARAAASRHWRLTVAHFNHGVRGKAADEDEAFVRDRAAALHLDVCVGRPAALEHTDEASLRTARYDWLAQAAQERGASHVAVGHTRDDQVETVLLRLVRGTGLRGLGGMRPARALSAASGVQVVRPLLALGRAHVLQYAETRNLSYRVDATNADRARARNRLRHDLLPLVRNLEPGVDVRIARLAEHLAHDEAYLADATAALDAALDRGRGFGWLAYDRPALAAAPVALRSRLLRHAFRTVAVSAYAPDADGIDGVMHALASDVPTGAVDWPGGVRVRWTAAAVVLARVPPPAVLAPAALAVPGETRWPATGQRLRTRVLASGAAPAPDALLHVAWERAPKPLTVRGWCVGDRWQPAGHGGPEPVAETLRRMGVPPDRRPAAPVLATDSTVWWVVGARPPAGAGVDGETRERLEVCIDNQDAWGHPL